MTLETTATFVFAGSAAEQAYVLGEWQAHGLECTLGDVPPGTRRGVAEVVDNVIAGMVVVGSEAVIRQAFRTVRNAFKRASSLGSMRTQTVVITMAARGAALFIGVNKQIDGARVQHAEKDAGAIHRTMTHPDIGALARARAQVIVGQEATRKNVAQSLVRVAKLAEQEQGWLVIYFAGHAVEVNGDVYLGLSDFDKDAIDADPSAGLCINDLGAKFLDRRRGMSRVLVVLDCCFGGAIAQDLASWSGRNAEMIFAAGPTSVAMEHDDVEHGALTSALLAGLAGEAATQAGDVTPESLYAYARESCTAAIGRAGADYGLPPLVLTSPGCQVLPLRKRSSGGRRSVGIRSRSEDFGPTVSELNQFQPVFADLLKSSQELWAAKKTGQATMRDAMERLLARVRAGTSARHAVVVRMQGGAAVHVASDGVGSGDIDVVLGSCVSPKLFDLMGSGHLFARRQFGSFVREMRA